MLTELSKVTKAKARKKKRKALMLGSDWLKIFSNGNILSSLICEKIFRLVFAEFKKKTDREDETEPISNLTLS